MSDEHPAIPSGVAAITCFLAGWIVAPIILEANWGLDSIRSHTTAAGYVLLCVPLATALLALRLERLWTGLAAQAAGVATAVVVLLIVG